MLNLYDILMESKSYDELILEGKDPREVLMYKFGNKVPEEMIDAIINIDPTKKKSYTQWTLSHYDDEADTINKALDNGRLKSLFDFFKTHQEKQIKDCPSVSEGLDAYVPKEKDTVLDKCNDEKEYVLMLGKYVPSELADDFDIVFNEDNWLIAVPNTYEASCKLGENCWWCTANHFGNGEGYYNEYLQRGGKYYINFDLSEGETLDDRTRKHYPYKRYQFHFESNQFKSAEEGEPDVTLEDLNIPQSAIDFYHEIDEDYDIGTMSDEERMERYEEQRFSDSIYLTDGLYLNVAYNDDYEYHEPTYADDDWYVFTENDNRDPIDWTAVDPEGEAASGGNDSYFIYRTKSDGGYLFIHKYEQRWISWDTVEIDDYLEMDEYNDVIFFIDRHAHSINAYADECLYSEDLPSRNCTSENTEIFVNKNLNAALEDTMWCFLEVVLPDGYHSLYYLSSDNGLEQVIRKDLPINGEYFELEENGHTDWGDTKYIIRGKFKSHSLYYDDESDTDYHLERELENGNYLVVRVTVTEESDGWGDIKKVERYNVLDTNTRQLIFTRFYNQIILIENTNLYKVREGNKETIFKLDGKPFIEEWYNEIKYLTREHDILGGINYEKASSPNNIADLIDISNGKVFARFKEIDYNFMPKNDCISVITLEGNKKLYNYKTRDFQIKDTQFDSILFNGKTFIACLDDNGNKYIMDFANPNFQPIHFDGRLRKGTYGNGYACHIENQGKRNMLTEYGVTLPVWCDSIIDVFIDGFDDHVIFKNEGKYYIYSLLKQNYILNPNGFNCVVKNYFGTHVIFHSGYDDGLSLTYDTAHDMFSGWSFNITPQGMNDNRGSMDKLESINPYARKEIVDFMNSLKGDNTQQQVSQETVSQPQEQETPSMAEDFKRMLNRLNEARKNTFMDKY